MGLHNRDVVGMLIDTIDGIEPGKSKSFFIETVQNAFDLVKDRSVYSCEDFAVRFCTSKGQSFSNTVLSLSTLGKYDAKPFIVVHCTPDSTRYYLANSTFLKKISHSSKELRTDNIKGSFNGSDIMKAYGGIRNAPENFETLFAMHEAFSWEENLERLVEATNGIVPHKAKFEPKTRQQIENLKTAADRAQRFLRSPYFQDLADDLDRRTQRAGDAIAVASLIENVNLRGRVIEELITTDDPQVIRSIRKALADNRRLSLKTDQKLGDYSKQYEGFRTETDIKTKILFLQSAPKAYNVDKMLEFLADDDSVYLFYLVGIDRDNRIKTRLVSVFDEALMDSTQIQHHWAGRSSRGVAQFSGQVLDDILKSGDERRPALNRERACAFIDDLLAR